MNKEEIITILIGTVITLLYLHHQEQSWFYKIEQKYCDRYKGHCELCNCWSCKRKEYIDEYKSWKHKEYIEKEKQIKGEM